MHNIVVLLLVLLDNAVMFICLTQMSDRKAELERKKAKLEQLRAEKKRADEEKRKGLHASGSSSSLGAGASPIASRSTEADDILKELGIVTSESPGQQPNVEPSAAKSSSEMTVGVRFRRVASRRKYR